MVLFQSILFACLAWLAVVDRCCAANLAPYRIAAGELPPFTVEKGERAPGALGELAEAMSQRIGAHVAVEFFPWQRAITMSLKQSRVAVLPLTRTSDREAQYRWLVKLYRQDFVFIRRHQTGSFDLDGMKRKRIVVLRGSPHVAVLRGEHFDHVSETYRDTLI
jgi:polar amino acid transport system substrate-binding protein